MNIKRKRTNRQTQAIINNALRNGYSDQAIERMIPGLSPFTVAYFRRKIGVSPLPLVSTIAEDKTPVVKQPVSSTKYELNGIVVTLSKPAKAVVMDGDSLTFKF